MEMYVSKSQKKLRCGYTTGTCVTAATVAAMNMLLLNKSCDNVKIMTPKGIELIIPIESTEIIDKKVICGVKKDSGDDPDITNGILIFVKASLYFDDRIERSEDYENRYQKNIDNKTRINTYSGNDKKSYIDCKRVHLVAGEGVGIVTKAGLEQHIGQPAINKVPRQMICEAVEEICRLADYDGKVEIEIIIPDGVEIAKKTFNPKLGIENGISILGTSGIVEPMSEKALIDTIEAEYSVKKAAGIKNLIIVPGNYGEEYGEKYLHLQKEMMVKCSNYIGVAIDLAVAMEFDSLLLIGNFGKLVKLAAGIMDTHSKMADGRFEIIGVHAALCGADRTIINQIMSCTTTEEALDILEANGYYEQVLKSIILKIDKVVKHRAGEKLKIDVVIFSEKRGYLCSTDESIYIKKSYDC